MKPIHMNGSSSKKRPMTPAERARRYRERQKLKLLGISNNLLEQALNGYARYILPEPLEKGGNKCWSNDVSEHQGDFVDVDNRICRNQEKEMFTNFKNKDIVIKVEPGLSDIIHPNNSSQDNTEDHNRGRIRLKENDPALPGSMEYHDQLNSMNTIIDIKTEPDLMICGKEDAPQRDSIKGSIPECSQLKEEYSTASRICNSVEEFSDDITHKEDREMQENYPIKVCDQSQQTSEIPIPITQRWMINWYGDKPIAEPVNESKIGKKRPMTAAERKRKSRAKLAKQRAEEKFFHLKPGNCSCGIDLKTRDELKAEVDALVRRKELLSAQIKLLQTQSQQMQLGFTMDDSENDSSNVSTNESSTECSRFKEVSIDAQTKIKRATIVDKDQEINKDIFVKKAFSDINGILDDYQIFGEFVAAELRNLKSDINRRRLKKMIQKVIIEILESED